MDQEIVDKTIEFVKNELDGAEAGHDWWHAYRVWELSKSIAKKEKANLLIVELGALLHDIADSKFHDGDETVGPKKAREFLEKIKVNEPIIKQVVNIIENISYRGSFDSQEKNSPELNIVQDADRLDAIGAIGIARTFVFCGHKGNEIYNPNIKPRKNLTKEEYKKDDSSPINHFYEKLLLLKGRMNTNTGKEMAQKRHEFMEEYLREFYAEWEGKK